MCILNDLHTKTVCHSCSHMAMFCTFMVQNLPLLHRIKRNIDPYNILSAYWWLQNLIFVLGWRLNSFWVLFVKSCSETNPWWRVAIITKCTCKHGGASNIGMQSLSLATAAMFFFETIIDLAGLQTGIYESQGPTQHLVSRSHADDSGSDKNGDYVLRAKYYVSTWSYVIFRFCTYPTLPVAYLPITADITIQAFIQAFQNFHQRDKRWWISHLFTAFLT